MKLSPASSRGTPRKQSTPSKKVELPSPSDGSKDNLINHTLHSQSDLGQENPVFSFDSVSLFSRAPSGTLETQPSADASFRALPPIRRGSYFPFLPSASRNNLVVPPLSGIEPSQRRSSFTSSTLRESSLIAATAALGRPRPLVSLSIDDISGHEFPMRCSGLLSISSMWSTSDLRRSLGALTKPDLDAVSHVGTASLSNFSGSFSERMHELVRAFSSRTQRAREKISQPPTPSSESDFDAKSVASGEEEPPPPRKVRLGSFMPGSRTSDALSDENHDHFVGVWHCKFKTPKFIKRLKFPETMEPHNKVYVSWLFLVSLAFLYNAVVIPLRGVFPYQTSGNLRYWLAIDYLCDVIYILDMFIFKCRLRFTNNGIIESDPKEARKHYMRKWMFKFDVMSLVPLDFFYFIKSVGVNPWLRLPRVLKIQTYWEFYERCDQASKSSAHAIRIIKTVSYMLFLIHVETCGYYAVSVYEGLGTNDWVYSGQGIAYIRCFYLATKTATSIGNNPTPTNKLEYMFMTFYWLSGVFLFALLIGQIRDIVEAATLVKDNYRKKMDSCLWYMQSINLPKEMKDRVREWFLYNWEQQKTIDERSLVSSLPKKLQTDLAINVHFNTLSKVQLFQDCERNLLYDLVLKLRPILYLPGDFICKKGEVGREMYIVTQGQVEVVGGEDGETVLATLHEGSVFGEISLLAMSGRGNRRTADVRSKGYTNVFTLSKHDFEMAMTEYPDAQALLKRRAKKLLKANEKMEKKKKLEAEEIIKTPPETPKLLQTVIQIMDPDSNFVKHLNPSVRNSQRSLRAPSRSHSHRLSASASNIHHLTPPRSHSFRLPSQPSNCPSLTLDPPGLQRKDSFDTDDDNDDDVFDDSSDDVSLSEVLHNALVNSSFDDSGNDDDDDDDDDGGDKELLIERYGTNFKQGKGPQSRQSPQRYTESSSGCEKEDRKSATVDEQEGDSEKREAEKELLKNGGRPDPVEGDGGLQAIISLHSESLITQRKDMQGLDYKQEDHRNYNTHSHSSPNRNNGNFSSKSSHDHQANQIQDETRANNNHRDQRNIDSFIPDVNLSEVFAETKHSGEVNKNETETKPKSAKLLPPNLNLGNQSEFSQEGVAGRVRKLSVVSPPVSPISPTVTENTSWSSGRTQFVSLKESSSDLILRCFTPVEIPPMQICPATEQQIRTVPHTSSFSPIIEDGPIIINGLLGQGVRSPQGDIPVEHKVRSPTGDIPAENRVTFSVEVHRQKSANSSTPDIRGHKETSV